MITHPQGASSSGSCLPVLVKQVGSVGHPVLLCLSVLQNSFDYLLFLFTI